MAITKMETYLSMYPSQKNGAKTGLSEQESSFWDYMLNKQDGTSSSGAVSYEDSNMFGSNSSSLISASVQETLFKYQETGSVFEEETQLKMFRRGVTKEEMSRFSEIVNDAASKGAYANPMKYINSLSDSDVEVIRKVHCLAETKGVTGNMTQEGAINLLLPPKNAVDIDNNGMVNRGQATLFQFPPPNAPQSVKDAWEKVTEGMNLKERMMAEFPFLVQSMLSNLKEDANGSVMGIYEPTETGYTNIFGTTEDAWSDLFDHMRMYQEGLSEYDPAGAAKNIEMINRFAEALMIQQVQLAYSSPTSEANSAAEDTDAREVEVINGKSVIVAGHNLDAREGVSLLRTVNMSTSAFNLEHWPEHQRNIDGSQNIESTGGLTEVSRRALEALPPGATGAYMNIDSMRPAGRWMEDPLKVPTSEQQNYYRRTTQALMEAVAVERGLKEKYGDDIKLIYSNAENSYVMLTKDDAKYDDMQSAESSVQSVINEVYRGFIDREAVEDILNQYGYTV